MAISKAVDVAAQVPTINYVLGSVLNHVLMHRTIMGGEGLLQLAKIGERADLLSAVPVAVELRRTDVPVPAGEVSRADEPGNLGG